MYIFRTYYISYRQSATRCILLSYLPQIHSIRIIIVDILYELFLSLIRNRFRRLMFRRCKQIEYWKMKYQGL